MHSLFTPKMASSSATKNIHIFFLTAEGVKENINQALCEWHECVSGW